MTAEIIIYIFCFWVGYLLGISVKETQYLIKKAKAMEEKNHMTREKAYFVGVHRYSNKSGKIAEIIGVEIVTPKGLEPRLCYHIQWSDKTDDWVPVHDKLNYKIISFTDISEGKISH